MNGNFHFKKCHITTIKNGDMIKHNNKIMTVNNRDIKISTVMGITIFGDSYNLGYKPVIKIEA